MMASKVTIVFIVYFIQGTLGQVLESQKAENGNGKAVHIRDVPFMASVHVRDSICGGSIIHRWFVLTAADCINKQTSSSDHVRVGSTDRNIGGKKYSIAKYIPHDQYYEGNPGKINYDIGLLKLTTYVNFNSLVAPIIPASSNLVFPGMKAFVSGWRQTVPGVQSLRLYDIAVKITPLSTCIEYYKNTQLTKLSICGDDSDAGICSGDRGGPLVVGDRQVGIYSAGGNPDYCGYYPVVYVNVTAHIDWIRSKIH